jgi:hypothetical protein
MWKVGCWGGGGRGRGSVGSFDDNVDSSVVSGVSEFSEGKVCLGVVGMAALCKGGVSGIPVKSDGGVKGGNEGLGGGVDTLGGGE